MVGNQSRDKCPIQTPHNNHPEGPHVLPYCPFPEIGVGCQNDDLLLGRQFDDLGITQCVSRKRFDRNSCFDEFSNDTLIEACIREKPISHSISYSAA